MQPSFGINDPFRVEAREMLIEEGVFRHHDRPYESKASLKLVRLELPANIQKQFRVDAAKRRDGHRASDTPMETGMQPGGIDVRPRDEVARREMCLVNRGNSKGLHSWSQLLGNYLSVNF